ncbi:hypothetical protein JCM18237_01800 [Halorubrum luteum]
MLGVSLGATTVGVGGFTLLFLLIGLTWAVIAVSAATIVTALTPDAIRGEALGMYGALVAVGGGVGGLLGGWLSTFGYTVVFAVAGGIVVAGAGIVALLARRLPDDPSAEETTSTAL